MASTLRHRTLGACALALSCALAGSAHAQTAGEKAAAAQALFDEAMRMMKAGQDAEACPKLEESLRLDSGMATQFRLAECYEKLGKIASAWASFVAVADAAAVARLTDREAAARKRAEVLAPRIPRLTISVPPAIASLPGLEILRDGVAVARPLWGVPVPVDPGPHVLAARATGKKPWEGTVNAVEATVLAASIPELAAEPVTVTVPPPPPRPPPPEPPRPEPRKSLVPGLVLGGAAVVAAGMGGAFLGIHGKDLSDAQTLSNTIKAKGGSCSGSAVDA
jgi:hypothetical protein